MRLFREILLSLIQWMFVGALIAYHLVDEKIDVIYVICASVGLMLMAGRLIDNANTTEKEKRRPEKSILRP